MTECNSLKLHYQYARRSLTGIKDLSRMLTTSASAMSKRDLNSCIEKTVLILIMVLVEAMPRANHEELRLLYV